MGPYLIPLYGLMLFILLHEWTALIIQSPADGHCFQLGWSWVKLLWASVCRYVCWNLLSSLSLGCLWSRNGRISVCLTFQKLPGSFQGGCPIFFPHQQSLRAQLLHILTVGKTLTLGDSWWQEFCSSQKDSPGGQMPTVLISRQAVKLQPWCWSSFLPIFWCWTPESQSQMGLGPCGGWTPDPSVHLFIHLSII